ncbi:MAG TPA: glycine cleavage system protein GcvH [Polyangia bacterium]|nr:glycine cleavage system protein GcvH [Polyangia bacterium]
MNIPHNLRYTGDHEWAKVEGGVAVVGVTEFAVEQLGDITLVELPAVGSEIDAGKMIGTIESVKAVSDMYSPLTGKVLAINEDLEDAPEKVNEDCYGEGWMLKIEIADNAEVEALMDAAAYQAHVDNQ